MEISITRVLDEINTPIDGDKAREFSIGFIRTTRGSKQGTIKRVDRAIKAGVDQRKIAQGSKTPRKKANLKKRKLLALYDRDANARISAPIYTIIEYNGYRVRH